jgi:hypothetical protein
MPGLNLGARLKAGLDFSGQMQDGLLARQQKMQTIQSFAWLPKLPMSEPDEVQRSGARVF